MKAINTISIAALLTVLTCSCAMTDNYTPAQVEKQAQTETLTIMAGFNGTKADNSVFKNNWNTSESIAVVSERGESRFLSINSGDVVEFASCTKSFDASSVTAVYPYIQNVSNGAAFSFAGQNGTLENINKFNLMTASGSVRNGLANLTFNNRIAVLCLSNVTLDACRAENIKSIELNGVAESVEVKSENGSINITPADNGKITVNNPSLFTSDIYVAFFADNTTSSIEIAVYDAMGGEWFLTLDNGSAFQAGQVYNVENVTLKGGYPITFNPGVENWN